MGYLTGLQKCFRKSLFSKIFIFSLKFRHFFRFRRYRLYQKKTVIALCTRHMDIDMKNVGNNTYLYLHISDMRKYWLFISLFISFRCSSAHFSKLWTLVTSKQIILEGCPWCKWISFSRALQWCITSAKNHQSQNR